jgi:hypothetical protein
MGDVLGNSMDMRGGQSKKSDEAGKGIKDLGTSELFFPLAISLCGRILRGVGVGVGVELDLLTIIAGKGGTVSGTSINASDQVANQEAGKADHLDLGFRKQT